MGFAIAQGSTGTPGAKCGRTSGRSAIVVTSSSVMTGTPSAALPRASSTNRGRKGAPADIATSSRPSERPSDRLKNREISIAAAGTSTKFPISAPGTRRRSRSGERTCATVRTRPAWSSLVVTKSSTINLEPFNL
jgi:hypothetical protein